MFAKTLGIGGKHWRQKSDRKRRRRAGASVLVSPQVFSHDWCEAVTEK